MYRRGGLAAILAGLMLATLFMFWPLQYQTGWVRSQGEVTKVYVTCGEPWSILFDQGFGDEVRTPWIEQQCVRKARTRPLNVVVFSVPVIVLGVVGVARGRYRRIPLRDIMRPLPKLGFWRRRPNL